MRRFISTVMLALVFASVWAPLTHAGPGQDATELMKYYYYHTVKDCGEGRPAYLCSGLMLRGTQHSSEFFVWNPSPTSVKNGGVSFSYLRDDAKYDRLGLLNYNGYAVKPADSVTPPEIKLSVLCFFPLDAWTDTRNQGGCGDNSTTPQTEPICNSVGITTAEQWLANFNKVNEERPRECGFDVREEKRVEAAKSFYEGIRAMQLLKGDSFGRQNEIRVATWAQNIPQQLPILAFIYTRDEGRAPARLDQTDLYTRSKKWVPVINLNLPDISRQDATFSYRAADQAIKEPAANCGPYIERAEWKRTFVSEINKEVDQLVVTPTACGRNFSEAQTDAAFTELANRARSAGKWQSFDDSSMRRQFLCLRLQYPDNPTWNLEPFRPYVPHQQAIAAKCNPLP